MGILKKPLLAYNRVIVGGVFWLSTMKLFIHIFFVGFLVFYGFPFGLLTTTDTAWADGDSGGGDDSGDDGGDDSGDDGSDDSGDDGSDGGGNSSDHGSNNNRGGRSSGSPQEKNKEKGFSLWGTPGKTKSQRGFKKLSSVIEKFKTLKKGRVLEAEIVKRTGIYYYKITYIRPTGKVGRYLTRARETSASKALRQNRNFNNSTR